MVVLGQRQGIQPAVAEQLCFCPWQMHFAPLSPPREASAMRQSSTSNNLEAWAAEPIAQSEEVFLAPLANFGIENDSAAEPGSATQSERPATQSHARQDVCLKMLPTELARHGAHKGPALPQSLSSSPDPMLEANRDKSAAAGTTAAARDASDMDSTQDRVSSDVHSCKSAKALSPERARHSCGSAHDNTHAARNDPGSDAESSSTKPTMLHAPEQGKMASHALQPEAEQPAQAQYVGTQAQPSYATHPRSLLPWQLSHTAHRSCASLPRRLIPPGYLQPRLPVRNVEPTAMPVQSNLLRTVPAPPPPPPGPLPSTGLAGDGYAGGDEVPRLRAALMATPALHLQAKLTAALQLRDVYADIVRCHRRAVRPPEGASVGSSLRRADVCIPCCSTLARPLLARLDAALLCMEQAGALVPDAMPARLQAAALLAVAGPAGPLQWPLHQQLPGPTCSAAWHSHDLQAKLAIASQLQSVSASIARLDHTMDRLVTQAGSAQQTAQISTTPASRSWTPEATRLQARLGHALQAVCRSSALLDTALSQLIQDVSPNSRKLVAAGVRGSAVAAHQGVGALALVPAKLASAATAPLNAHAAPFAMPSAQASATDAGMHAANQA